MAERLPYEKEETHEESQDRRPITEGEMIGLFEFYLRKWCEEHPGEDTVVITNDDGKKIFEATLLDKEE